MGAGASAPTGVGSSPVPIALRGGSFSGGYPPVAPSVSTPIAPVITPKATPAPINLFPKAGDPQGGKGGNPTSNASTQAQSVRPPMYDAGFGDPRNFNFGATSAPNTQLSGALAAGLGQPNAPAAPQQPQFNPFMQTYGQNNTPQQQMFNRFQPPQQFRQPVTQPAQGPVYADQSLNAPGNQPQQFQQPQYGRFGRGFMPQNRFGYDRQMDQLRGGYNRPMPQIMPQQDMGYGNGMPYSSPAPSAAPADAEAAWNLNTQTAQFAPGADMVKAKQDFMQRYNPRPQQLGGMQQAAFMNNLLSGQQQMPAYGGGYGRFGQQGSQVPILKTLGLDAAFGGDADFVAPNFNFGATSAPNTQLSGARALAAGLGQPYVQQSPELNIPATREAKYPTAGQTQIPTYAQPYVQKLQGGQAPAGGNGGSPVASAQLNPFQAALVKGGTPYVQGAPGAPYAIGQGIPGGAPGGYMPLMNSNGTPVSSLASANPAGGKGGNPTAQLPPPPKQDGTPGSWSTYI